MKSKHERLENIEVIKEEDGKIHILGRSGSNYPYYLHHIIHDTSGRIIKENSFKQKDEELLFLGFISSFFVIGLPLLFYELMPFNLKRIKKTEEYFNNVRKFYDIQT